MFSHMDCTDARSTTGEQPTRSLLSESTAQVHLSDAAVLPHRALYRCIDLVSSLHLPLS